MNLKSLFFTIALLSFPLLSFSQSEITKATKANFKPWNGNVYELPIVNTKKGRLISKGIIPQYSDTIHRYPELGKITLKKINIKETNIKHGTSPGVERNISWIIV